MTHQNKVCTLNTTLISNPQIKSKQICLGEIRGVEARSIIKILNGKPHGSMTTVHAKNPSLIAKRIMQLVSAIQ